MKICKDCKLLQPRINFRPAHNRKNALKPYCMDCSRARSRISDAKRRARSREQTIAKKLVTKSCESCNWFSAGLCAVKNPGTTCQVENTESCLKWERIKLIEPSRGYQENCFDNIFTVDMDFDTLTM